MKVVIVWDRNRNSEEDIALTNKIIDSCKEKYPKLRLVIKGTDRGIGRAVKRRLTDPVTHVPRELDWTEAMLIHHNLEGELPKVEFSLDYDALNAVLVE